MATSKHPHVRMPNRDDLDDITEGVSDLAETAKTRAKDGVRRAAAGVDRARRRVSDDAEQAAETVAWEIETRPFASVLIALAVGYAGGRLLR